MDRRWPAHSLAFVEPLLIAGGVALGGGWTFLAVFYGFVVVSIVDVGFGNRAGASLPTGTPEDRGFGTLTCLMLPVMVAVLALTLWFIGRGGATTLEIIGCTLSLGTASASSGIVTAHELVHRREAWRRGLGVALLALVNYAHFRIEHVHGHHKNVGLRHDPATARLGESFYAFLLRSIVGQWLSAWRIEHARLVRRGRSRCGPGNRMIWYTAAPPALCAVVWLTLGPVAVLAFVIQGLLAVGLLESINYLEHYGLPRAELEPGQFEPFGPQHSWNSAHPGTDLSLFNLGRHSSHHIATHLPYQELDNAEAWPQLPYGYPTTSLLALVPPLWRRQMDPLARAASSRASGMAK